MRSPRRATGSISELNFLFRDKSRQKTVLSQITLDAFGKDQPKVVRTVLREAVSKDLISVGSSGLDVVQHWLDFGGEQRHELVYRIPSSFFWVASVN